MKSIGIIGQGFVGTAIFEGMKHAFDIVAYDIKTGMKRVIGGVESTEVVEDTPSTSAIRAGYFKILQETDGPIFVCIPTPMNPDGSCNTKIVEGVLEVLSDLNRRFKPRVACVKSTMTPGTTAHFDEMFDHLHVCYNPEFLTERNAIEDFKNQDRIIIGGPREGTNVLKQMYETAYPDVPVTKTSSTIAELVKYTTNCFLATKVSFANELASLCEKLGEDYDKVVEYATKDKRLGTSHWAVPGPDGKKGFSGSCFPKDLNALMKLFEEKGLECNTMKGAWETNLRVRPEQDWNELKGRAVTSFES